MMTRRSCVLLAVFTTILLAADCARALDIVFAESDEAKEGLKLKYDISVTEHKNGRVSIVLSITDQGYFKPWDAVELYIRAREDNKNDRFSSDLFVKLSTQEENGKQVAQMQMIRELAERARIEFVTHHLKGKVGVLGVWRYSIPIAKHLKDDIQKK